MKLIAHRGNIHGKSAERENSPRYLHEALKEGFEIEVDVWRTSDGIFFGHDGPRWAVDEDIFESLESTRSWYHAKNREALYVLSHRGDLNFFWIEDDAYAVTSKGYVWIHTKTGKLIEGGICVLPEERASNAGIELCGGICSDNVAKYAAFKT